MKCVGDDAQSLGGIELVEEALRELDPTERLRIVTDALQEISERLSTRPPRILN